MRSGTEEVTPRHRKAPAQGPWTVGRRRCCDEPRTRTWRRLSAGNDGSGESGELGGRSGGDVRALGMPRSRDAHAMADRRT